MRAYFTTSEFLVTLGLFTVSVVFLIASLQLPAGTFDPLGPGAAPEMVSALLCLLCAIVIIGGLRRHARGEVAPKELGASDIIERSGASHPKILAGFAVLLVAYLVAFELKLGHFITLTFPFVVACVLLLGGINRRTVVTGTIVGGVLSTGLFYLLTRFFVINLPGI